MIVRLALAVAFLAPALAHARGPNHRGGRHGPPPESFRACQGLEDGASCSFQTPHGREDGVCASVREGFLCVPSRFGPPPPPREDRYEGEPMIEGTVHGAEGSAQPARPAADPQASLEAARAALTRVRGAAHAQAAALPMPAAQVSSVQLPAAAQVPEAPPRGAAEPVLSQPVVPIGSLEPAKAPTEAKPAAAAEPAPKPPLPIALAGGVLFALGLAMMIRSRLQAKADAAPAAPAAITATRPIPSSETPTVLEPAPPTIATAPKGLVAGNYQVRRELGTGGMGVVFEALDVALDRPVALKKMRPEIGRSPRGKERFLAEARMVAKLQHPNIVGIHGVLEDAGDLYLVLEYVDGQTLDQLLVKHQRLPPEHAVRFFSGVAAAVDYAHSQRVIHRDLKPSNIMLDAGGRAKVMDFGIAHQARVTISQMTMAEAAGTQAYMPPEQELGRAVRESDVYAFAAVAYETLVGDMPFPGPNFHLQKTQMSFARPSATAPSLPKALDPVFERALHPEPKQRHPTTTDFVDALHHAIVGSRSA